MIARRRRRRYVVMRQFMNTEIAKEGVATVTFSHVAIRAFTSRREAKALAEEKGWRYFVATMNALTPLPS